MYKSLFQKLYIYAILAIFILITSEKGVAINILQQNENSEKLRIIDLVRKTQVYG